MVLGLVYEPKSFVVRIPPVKAPIVVEEITVKATKINAISLSARRTTVM